MNVPPLFTSRTDQRPPVTCPIVVTPPTVKLPPSIRVDTDELAVALVAIARSPAIFTVPPWMYKPFPVSPAAGCAVRLKPERPMLMLEAFRLPPLTLIRKPVLAFPNAFSPALKFAVPDETTSVETPLPLFTFDSALAVSDPPLTVKVAGTPAPATLTAPTWSSFPPVERVSARALSATGPVIELSAVNVKLPMPFLTSARIAVPSALLAN